MKNDWLWDRKLSVVYAKNVLKQPNHKEFIFLAALLLARKNDPKEVFKEYLNPIVFCKNWANVKKRMRLDKWNEPRIIFWQAIYERLTDKYRKKGIVLKKESPVAANATLAAVGGEIRNIRREQGLSQKELANKLGVAQQIISRIEKGRENISLLTLYNVSRALGLKIKIEFE